MDMLVAFARSDHFALFAHSFCKLHIDISYNTRDGPIESKLFALGKI